MNMLQNFTQLANSASNFAPLLKAACPSSAPSGAIGDSAPKGYQNVSYQDNAEFLAAYGMLTSNETMMENAVKAFTYGFIQQRTDGSFNNPQAPAGDLADNLDADAFFLSAFVRAFLLLETGPSSIARSMIGMLPTLERGLLYLQSQQTALLATDAKNGNRLFFDAIALVLGGQLIGDTSLVATGEPFAIAGATLQNVAGWISENGGWDSSYQGVSMLNLSWLISSIPTAAPLLPVLGKAALWEATLISPTGIVLTIGNTRTAGQETDPNGEPKTVDLLRVALGMMTSGVVLDIPAYVALGNAVAGQAIKG